MTQQSHSSHQGRYRRPIRSQLKAINGEGAQALLLSPITLEQPGWQPTKTLSHKSSLLSASRWFRDELISGHDMVIYVLVKYCDPGQLLTTWHHSWMIPWQVWMLDFQAKLRSMPVQFLDSVIVSENLKVKELFDKDTYFWIHDEKSRVGNTMQLHIWSYR